MASPKIKRSINIYHPDLRTFTYDINVVARDPETSSGGLIALEWRLSF